MTEDRGPTSKPRQRYAGPDRRRVDRSPPAPLHVLGRARVAQDFPQTRMPPIPRGEWFLVVDRDPAELLALAVKPALPWYVWLLLGPRVGRHVLVKDLEVEEAT